MLVLALLAVAGFIPTQAVRIHVDAELFPNAAHNLACLSGRLPCSRPNFEKFWHEKLKWTSEDQTALDRWNDTMKAVSGRQPNPQPSPFLPNTPAWYPELVVVNKLVAAALASASETDFRKRAQGLALPEEIAVLSASLGHFAARLEPWWKQTGRPYAEAQRKAIEKQLKSLDANRQAARVAAFFESELPTRDFYMHLIPRDDRESKDATATFAQNHMVVELTDEMKPAETVSIILHEMTHALYELAPVARHRQLIAAFAGSPQPQAQALYAILNEGLATAVQLAADKRAGVVDDDPYHHPFIPRIGQANAGPLASALDAGGSLFSGYMDTYLKVSGGEIGTELASPRFVLLSGIIADLGDLKGAVAAFREAFPMLSAAGFGDRTSYTDLNIIYLLPYDKLGAVLESWPVLSSYREQFRGFAFSAARGTKGRVYVLAGRDEGTVTELVRKLSEVREATPEGLILSVN